MLRIRQRLKYYSIQFFLRGGYIMWMKIRSGQRGNWLSKTFLQLELWQIIWTNCGIFMVRSSYQCNEQHFLTTLKILQRNYYHLKNTYIHEKGWKLSPLLPFLGAVIINIGIQGRSGYHIAWYHLLGFMDSTIHQILKHWKKLFHKTKSLSRTDGVELTDW